MKLVDRALKMISKAAFSEAIHAVTSASAKGAYQPKEPDTIIRFCQSMTK